MLELAREGNVGYILGSISTRDEDSISRKSRKVYAYMYICACYLVAFSSIYADRSRHNHCILNHASCNRYAGIYNFHLNEACTGIYASTYSNRRYAAIGCEYLCHPVVYVYVYCSNTYMCFQLQPPWHAIEIMSFLSWMFMQKAQRIVM